MKSFKQVFFFFGLFLSTMFAAQQVIKTDTISGNAVKISMDKKIMDLLQGAEEKCSQSLENNSQSNSYNTPAINLPERKISTEEACRRNPRIMGVKILIATVKSNQEANEVGFYFRSKFPGLKILKDASLRPNYKIMAGSYFNKNAASSDFKNVKKLFKDAKLVNYMVFCEEAK